MENSLRRFLIFAIVGGLHSEEHSLLSFYFLFKTTAKFLRLGSNFWSSCLGLPKGWRFQECTTMPSLLLQFLEVGHILTCLPNVPKVHRALTWQASLVKQLPKMSLIPGKEKDQNKFVSWFLCFWNAASGAQMVTGPGGIITLCTKLSISRLLHWEPPRNKSPGNHLISRCDNTHCLKPALQNSCHFPLRSCLPVFSKNWID